MTGLAMRGWSLSSEVGGLGAFFLPLSLIVIGSSFARRTRPCGFWGLMAFETGFWRIGGATDWLLFSRIVSALNNHILS